jgi:AmiR/NasT family two-component response regulator
MSDPTESDRTAGRQSEASQRDEQIHRLEAEARRRLEQILGLEADAIVRDERISALVSEIEHLTRAREHAAVIEQAKGVIMSTMRCGPDAAFAVLVTQSQHQNRKVWDVASELAAAQDREARTS